MATNFDEVLNNFTLNWEGRINENVENDPGGATHWGVTQADYDAFRKEHGLPKHNVFGMTPGEVTAVYTEHYADHLHYPDLPNNVFSVMFDAAVNLGVSRSVGFLQGVVGVAQDGVFGPNTLAGMKLYIGMAESRDDALCAGMIARRVQKYHALVNANPSLEKFLPGWLNRCKALQTYVGV
jgi:lysozyme family protein